MSGKVWLHLFHGRDTVDEDMDDWGYDGPTIGPLEFVHTTYGDNIKFHFTYHADAVEFGLEQDEMINLVEGCFPFQGKFYGDYSVFTK